MEPIEHIKELNNKISELTNMNSCMNNLIMDGIHDKLLNIYNDPKVKELLEIMSKLRPDYTVRDSSNCYGIMGKDGIIRYSKYTPDHAKYLINKFDIDVAIKIIHDDIVAILNNKISTLSQTNLELTQTLNSLGISSKSDEVSNGAI